MKKYDHLRKKAIELRLNGLSIDDICNRFKLSKGTVWHWIKDIPLQRKRLKPNNDAAKKAAMLKYKKLRDEAYKRGKQEFRKLSKDQTFRDFVCMYLGEGYRRDRNQVSICNSNPMIVQLGNKWITQLTSNKTTYRIQYHADQNIEKLKEFWGDRLGIEKSQIKVQRKSNSNQLKGRKWRSEYGVLTIRASDTYLRARIQAWMDIIQSEW